MSSKEHDDYTNYIIQAVSKINPYTNDEGRIGYVYASGFLASYLANLFEKDPFVFKQFEKHIKELEQEQRKQRRK